MPQPILNRWKSLLGGIGICLLIAACTYSNLKLVQGSPWPYGSGPYIQQRSLTNLEAVLAAAGSTGKVEWVTTEDSLGNPVVEANVDRAGAHIEKPQTVWFQWTTNKNTGRVSLTGLAVDREDKSPFEAALLVSTWTSN